MSHYPELVKQHANQKVPTLKVATISCDQNTYSVFTFEKFIIVKDMIFNVPTF